MLGDEPTTMQRDSIGKAYARAILAIADDRVATRSQLYSNLMLSSRFQRDFKQSFFAE